MGRRITRKQLKQDEFVSAADTVLRWFSENWRPIVAGLGGLSVAILIWWTVDRWSTSESQEASIALRAALVTYDESMSPGEEAADLTVARQQFQDVIDRHGRADQADVARFYLARIHLDQGELDEARNLLVQVVEGHREDALGRLATLDLVRLRIDSGQGAEVAQELEAMVVGQDSRLTRDAALYELGHLYLVEQDHDQAREYFQKLVDEFPESPYLPQARQQLTELG